MTNSIKLLLAILSASDRKGGVFIIILMIGTAVFEVVGIGFIFPLLQMVADPSSLDRPGFLKLIFTMTGLDDRKLFLLMLAILVGSVLLFVAGLRSFALYAIHRYVNLLRHSFSLRIFDFYVTQPYLSFTQKNVSEMMKDILSEVDIFIGNYFLPAAQVLSQVFVLIAISLFLLLLHPILAFICLSFLLIIYFLIFRVVKIPINNYAQQRMIANTKRFKLVDEALTGIKYLRVANLESSAVDRFQSPSRVFSINQAKIFSLSEAPRYVIEAILLVALISIATWHSLARNEAESILTLLPTLGLFGVGALKLLPAAQALYRGFAQMKAGIPSLKKVHLILSKSDSNHVSSEKVVTRGFDKSVVLTNVTFQYPSTDLPALRSVSLKITKGSFIGIVGETGSGKSTLLDILLGLLPPDLGEITVDDQVLKEGSVRSWQQVIGFVPQQIFLTDNTIAENIAFAVPPNEIDYGRVIECARIAQIHEFVMQLTSDGYQTLVGDKGARLSGGQIQRIALARCLYRRPQVLILDEATSALDTHTEMRLIRAIRSLSTPVTIVFVSHHVSALAECDEIFVFDNGRFSDSGSFQELKIRNGIFRRLLDG